MDLRFQHDSEKHIIYLADTLRGPSRERPSRDRSAPHHRVFVDPEEDECATQIGDKSIDKGLYSSNQDLRGDCESLHPEKSRTIEENFKTGQLPNHQRIRTFEYSGRLIMDLKKRWRMTLVGLHFKRWETVPNSRGQNSVDGTGSKKQRVSQFLSQQ